MTRPDQIIHCPGGAYLVLRERDDGRLEIHAVAPGCGAMAPVRLDAAAEKGLSVALQLRERARLARSRRRAAGDGA